ncbi:MAG: restriction endonuclease subunit S [Bacteroidetes bacterium]|nr:restriction endonuclease subunit S [Bacteroidota bacterium]
MKSNYKRIGEHIRLVDERNKGLQVKQLLGLSISKQFIPSVANIIGTDMENYKIIRRNQFACSTMQVRRDKKMPVALLQEVDEAIISQAYPIFEVKNEKELLPEYLMMWFARSEFDREACFHAVGGVRGSLEWEDFENLKLPIPHPDKQKEIVKEYNTIVNRIALNNQVIKKLEETAQAIYKQWFVEFEFPNENGQPYKSNGGEMVESELGEIPKGWEVVPLEDAVTIIRGASPRPIDDYMSKDNTGMPWVKIADATACATKYLFETNEYISSAGVKQSRKISIGTLILSNSASPGLPKFLMIDACVHDGWLIFDDYKKNLSKEFLYNFLLLNRTKILSSSNGSVFNNLKTEILKSYQIIIPDETTLKKVTKLFQSIDAQFSVTAKTDFNMKELLSILLSKLATIEN